MSRVRIGQSRKIFLPPEAYLEISNQSRDLLLQLTDKRCHGYVSSAEYIAEILMIFFNIKFGHRSKSASWASREKPETRGSRTLEVLMSQKWRGLPDDVSWVLSLWHQHPDRLKLSNQEFSVLDLARLQAHGQRGVSWLDSFMFGSCALVNDRDPVSFLIHDLLHAALFFRDPQHHQDQVLFSRWLSSWLQDPETPAFMSVNPKITEEIEYLIADMNTHLIHSLKCLKSILRNHPQTRRAVFDKGHELFQESTLAFFELFETLNSPQEKLETREQLKRLWDQMKITNQTQTETTLGNPFLQTSTPQPPLA